METGTDSTSFRIQDGRDTEFDSQRKGVVTTKKKEFHHENIQVIGCDAFGPEPMGTNQLGTSNWGPIVWDHMCLRPTVSQPVI